MAVRSPWLWALSLAAMLVGTATTMAEQRERGKQSCGEQEASGVCDRSRGQMQAREVEILDQAKRHFNSLVLDHVRGAVWQPPNGPLWNGSEARTENYCQGILSALQRKKFTLFPEPQAKSVQSSRQIAKKELSSSEGCQWQQLLNAPSGVSNIWLYISVNGVASLNFEQDSGTFYVWAQPRSCASPPLELSSLLKTSAGRARQQTFQELTYAVIAIAGNLHLAVGGVLWMHGSNLAWRDRPFMSLRAGRMDQLANMGIDWPEQGSEQGLTDDQLAFMSGRVLAVYPLDVPWLPGSPKIENPKGTVYGPCLWNLED